MSIRAKLMRSFGIITLFLVIFAILNGYNILKNNELNDRHNEVADVYLTLQRGVLSRAAYTDDLLQDSAEEVINRVYDAIASLAIMEDKSEVMIKLDQDLVDYIGLFNQYASNQQQLKAIKLALEENFVRLVELIGQAPSSEQIKATLLTAFADQDPYLALPKVINFAMAGEANSSDFDEKLIFYRVQRRAKEVQSLYSKELLLSGSIDQLQNTLKGFEENILAEANDYSIHLEEQLLVSRRNQFLVFLLLPVITLTLAIIFSNNISRNLSLKITKVVFVTGQIAKGDYSRRVMIEEEDEFAVLGEGINTMARQLEENTKRVVEANITLEKKVEEKTIALQQAKAALEGANRQLRLDKEKLSSLARIDMLTGLLNRRALMDILDQRGKEARRYGKTYGVMLIDIDFFKQVNDTFGHQVGDEVLKVLADTMKETLRDIDAVGRYGGEEFLIIFNESSHKGLIEAGERLRLIIAKLQFPSAPVTVTISGGLVPFTGEPLDQILKEVDDLLYQAKKSGRNQIVYNKRIITS